MVLLDTEGLHDVEKENTGSDIELFVLALMLCNHFVYNAQGAFGSETIEQLQ